MPAQLSSALTYGIFYFFIFCVLLLPTAAGLGNALEVCREYLKSLAAGCLPQSSVGLFFPEAHIWEMRDEEHRGSSQLESIDILPESCSIGSPLSWLTQWGSL